MIDIALEAQTSESTVHNFEAHGRPVREIDAIVAAYARLCGTTEDALWRAAIDEQEPGDET